jgi:hypothetical protein
MFDCIIGSDQDVVGHKNGLQDVDEIESEQFVPLLVHPVVNCLVKVRTFK